ncbi:hypothetical protein G4B88_019053 [Cannabis sativa]|uniref:Neprosin PEP catalytic domain-containing protein n=1 Tax=Cannabis sativa TaxID=3483 RepID=A0A7J6H0N0_CANSA|nr:hypothetical protein G4B88_019053 [Cannabis sativa]
MGMREFFMVAIVLCTLLCYCESRKQPAILSRDEILEIENQLERLNKSSIKAIKTQFGDIYDCVNFYEQPAFDHPLLKNHKYDFQMRPSSRPKSIVREGNPPKNVEQVNPSVYGDNRTRIFIYFQAGELSCFNTVCPGFVLVNPKPMIEMTLRETHPGRSRGLGSGPGPGLGSGSGSKSGSRTESGSGFGSGSGLGWSPFLSWSTSSGPVPSPGSGFRVRGTGPGVRSESRPGSRSSGGLKDLATYIDWGGKIYSPLGQIGLPIGSGLLLKQDTRYDAY